MLYISRCVGKSSYGIVDTDDDSEQIVSYTDLLSMCHSFKKLHINGVKLSGGVVDRVEVYQHTDYVTGRQAKLKSMRNVELIVYKDMITAIRWDASKVDCPVEIRMSDYGRRCADRLLWGNLRAGGHILTLIFDDNIEVSSYSFSNPGFVQISTKRSAYGVVFDIRQLSSVNSFYINLLEGESDFSILDKVIDRPDRKSKLVELLKGIDMKVFGSSLGSLSKMYL